MYEGLLHQMISVAAPSFYQEICNSFRVFCYVHQ